MLHEKYFWKQMIFRGATKQLLYCNFTHILTILRLFENMLIFMQIWIRHINNTILSFFYCIMIYSSPLKGTPSPYLVWTGSLLFVAAGSFLVHKAFRRNKAAITYTCTEVSGAWKVIVSIRSLSFRLHSQLHLLLICSQQLGFQPMVPYH